MKPGYLTKMYLRLLPILLFGFNSACSDFAESRLPCYAKESSNAYRLFASKTTYTRGHEYFQSTGRVLTEVPQGCTPVMFYLFARHAIRYPEGEDIVGMEKVLVRIRDSILKAADEGRSEFCDDDVAAFRNWRFNMVQEQDNGVTPTGAQETMGIARRFKALYPELLDPQNSDMSIGVSRRTRTNETAAAFLEGLGGSNIHDYNAQIREFTEFHTYCEEKLKRQGVKLENAKVVEDFHTGPLIESIKSRVSKRLGLKEVLKRKHFKYIYRTCEFGYAVDGDSPWCAAFTNQELVVLEYLEDLDDYHGDAYGRDINSQIPCDLVRDLLIKVDGAMKPNAKPRSYLHFSHAGAIKPLASYFGLFKGFGASGEASSNPGEDYCAFDKENTRAWRSSYVAPFGANFAFVLHKCASAEGSRDANSFKLMTLVQESPMRVDGCDAELCPVQQFVSRYQSALGCDLNRLCRI